MKVKVQQVEYYSDIERTVDVLTDRLLRQCMDVVDIDINPLPKGGFLVVVKYTGEDDDFDDWF